MNQLTQEQFEDKLSFWINGSLPKSEAEAMNAFLEANPGLNGMYKLEMLAQKGVDYMHSPLTTDESWTQLRKRWKPALRDTNGDNTLATLKRWLGIGESGRRTGWQIGFSFAAAVCVIQAIVLLQLAQNSETPWAETRSGGVLVPHNIRAKPLPLSHTAAVLANLRETEVEIVGGPNGDGELLMLSPNSVSASDVVDKLTASGLFEYVVSVKAQKQVQP